MAGKTNLATGRIDCRRQGLLKKYFAAGAAILALTLAAVLVVPAVVDLGRFKRTYLPLVEEALDRRVDVGAVRLALLPSPSIKVSNLAVSDNPTVSAQHFFAAEEVQLGLRFWPLLRGRFEITEFVLEKPVFNLLKRAEANKAGGAGKSAAVAKRVEGKQPSTGLKAPDSAFIPLVLPARLRIRDGQLNIGATGAKPLKIDGIELSMQEFSSDKPFSYRASFDYPGLKTVSLEGRLRYREEQASLELEENFLKIQNLLLPVEGNVTHLATLPRLDLHMAGDGLDARAIFQILASFGLAPPDTEIAGPMALRIALTGPSSGPTTQIHGELKDVKVQSKRALKGTINGRVSLRMAWGMPDVRRGLQGEGNLLARDGELTHRALIDKLQRVTARIGWPQHQRRQLTTFQTLDAEFTLTNGLVDLKRIHLVNPQLELNGSGSMTLAQASLNVAMDATLSPQASSRAGGGKTIGFFKNNRGQLVVPLKVTGRLENPAVDIDGEKLAERGATRSLEKSVGIFFKQLFRR
jgi:hypothetical protein